MQNIDWNAVRDFLAVVRQGSLSRAGDQLGVSASTVGRRIETLEAALGFKLFARSPTGYHLTDEGRDLVARAEHLEDTALALERRATPLVRGRVRLATAENFANSLIIPHLGQFRRTNPELTLEIITDIRPANLNRRDADVALRLVRPARGNLTLRRVGRQCYGLYGSLDYFQSRPLGTRLRLEEHDLVAWSDAYADLPAAIWIDAALQGRAPAVATSSLYAQVIAAHEGLGLAVLPCFLGDADPSLRRVACDVDAINQDIWLVVHSDLAASARVRATTDFLTNLMRRHGDRLRGAHSLHADAGDRRPHQPARP